MEIEEEVRIYIENKYWKTYIGDTDDSLNLITFLEEQGSNKISFFKILKKIGLHKQGKNFRKTVSHLRFTNSMGFYVDFHFAINVIIDLAAILLECKVSGSVDLHELKVFDTSSHIINIIATPEYYEFFDRILADFSNNPLEYDLSELVPEEDMREMAEICEDLRQELLS